ncbi:hypothetical protein A3A79_01200 [Candidatus Gottesmanbacteria bacterium RIFCSPLOWO2_01_FULL_43_11b]|uniref:Glycosyltransferase 2-like domain-containing protein n=1 Tax=Candidatus Gottesmanbacteria bacterium RIFCSPLOWO2_01_FULL_43_11b TaxID=1798392 RepID=A0A1F6AGT1_9BACT|nr:MAG: hypothetical protein A3A79_01200 [Candidatus Gottesmanbacteria bacterium RIFCSPLOWO2_01_FULL_43_11b]
MTTPTLSVIIPVYNEERTLPGVVEIVRTWGKAAEIIVVNDGSTDDTVASVKQFGKTVQVISYKKNKGKAFAMVAGVKIAKARYVLFLDGDLIGLTHRDLDRLIAPVIRKQAVMTIGVRQTNKKRPNLAKPIGGERAIKRDDLLPILGEIKHLGYGVELFLNNYFKKRDVRYVNMPFVSILTKYEKQTFQEGTVSYIKEAIDLTREVAKQQTGNVTPHIKRLYKMILEYLKYATLGT